VALDYWEALVTIPLDDTPGATGLTNSGSVSAFFEPANWALRSSLNAGGFAGDYEQFGDSVDHRYLTTVVGAVRDGATGAAYIFAHPNNHTSPVTLQKRLTGPYSTADPSFGTAVAVWEDTVVVSEPKTVLFLGTPLHIFRRGGNMWNSAQELWGPPGWKFSLAIAGYPGSHEVIVAGDPRGRVNVPLTNPANMGIVHVSARHLSGTYFLAHILKSSTPTEGDRFGHDVDIHYKIASGYTVLVGAPDANNGANNAGADEGAAFIYTFPVPPRP
jgi:hypothetical protein